jgi:transcriptional regulator with XRE-family HTH domain
VERQRFRPPNPVDAQVGKNIIIKRAALGLSQAYMADQIGLTLDQYCECEAGTHRFGAERLLKIARLLGADPQELFETPPSSATKAIFN